MSETHEIRWWPDDLERTKAEWPEFDEARCAVWQVAPDEHVLKMLATAISDTGDDRSPWMWIRLPEGTLIFGCFPQGDTYYDTEEGRGV